MKFCWPMTLTLPFGRVAFRLAGGAGPAAGAARAPGHASRDLPGAGGRRRGGARARAGAGEGRGGAPGPRADERPLAAAGPPAVPAPPPSSNPRTAAAQPAGRCRGAGTPAPRRAGASARGAGVGGAGPGPLPDDPGKGAPPGRQGTRAQPSLGHLPPGASCAQVAQGAADLGRAEASGAGGSFSSRFLPSYLDSSRWEGAKAVESFRSLADTVRRDGWCRRWRVHRGELLVFSGFARAAGKAAKPHFQTKPNFFSRSWGRVRGLCARCWGNAVWCLNL